MIGETAKLFDLTGRTALVTGACGHLGAAIAEGLAEAGATVVVSSRSLEKAENFAASLPKATGQHHFGVALDQMNEDSIRSGFGTAVSRAKEISILVNNAHEAVGADWSSVTGDEFSQQLKNTTGYFLLAREFREHAVANSGKGTVIMLGSMYGEVGSYPDTYEGICSASPAAYHALKGGILHLTRHLAVYWAADGIRVNSLSPGPFPSPKAPPALIERLVQKSPMKRMGHPSELKGAAVFLASDASSYVTGHNLVIDGGWTAW
jgi:NAD(P)-dependent dehydrogenase (short-subunit alcohol dehydrogenase family)